MISYSWERPPFPAKNVLKLLYQDGANGAQSIMVSLISLQAKYINGKARIAQKKSSKGILVQVLRSESWTLKIPCK